MSLFDYLRGKIVAKELWIFIVVAVAAVAGTIGAGAVITIVAIFLFSFFGSLFFPNLFVVGIVCLVLSELFFWTSKRQPKSNESVFWFSFKWKVLYFLEALFWVIMVNGVWHFLEEFLEFLDVQQELVQALIGFVGWGTLAVIVIVAYVALNSLKFKQNLKQVVEPKRKRKRKNVPG